MNPYQGNTILFRSFQQLPRVRLGQFELTHSPPRALDLPRALHPQLRRARRQGLRTPSKTTDANLDCAFVENILFDIDPGL